MTDGMKSGAGSDPFATGSSDDHESAEVPEEQINETGKEDESTSISTADADSSPEQGTQSADSEQDGEELPYIFDRYSVKDDRKMVQYFLRENTQQTEKDALKAVEQELGADVLLIDLREALVRVGAENLDEVADELRDWGYRFREE